MFYTTEKAKNLGGGASLLSYSMERKRVCGMAIKLASHVKYKGWGRLSFYDIDRKTFYFIEVNTRIKLNILRPSL